MCVFLKYDLNAAWIKARNRHGDQLRESSLQFIDYAILLIYSAVEEGEMVNLESMQTPFFTIKKPAKYKWANCTWKPSKNQGNTQMRFLRLREESNSKLRLFPGTWYLFILLTQWFTPIFIWNIHFSPENEEDKVYYRSWLSWGRGARHRWLKSKMIFKVKIIKNVFKVKKKKIGLTLHAHISLGKFWFISVLGWIAELKWNN